jgi:protein-disulfide isomerase
MKLIYRNLFFVIVLGLIAVSAFAADTSLLRPPKGERVALVEFADLQCPDCARAEQVIEQAVKTYKIPVVRYDFPLPMHNWSFDAHVMGRWFDTKGKGEEFRKYIYQNQPQINPKNLRGFAERFAAQNGLQLPFVVDPKGELAAKVRADYQLGQRVGIDHTPTIYVVSNTQRGTPFVEVVDRSQLFNLIDRMMAESQPVLAEKSPAKKSAKPAAKKRITTKKTTAATQP